MTTVSTPTKQPEPLASPQARDSVRSRFMNERTALTLLLAAAAIVGIAASRDPGISGLHPGEFWAMKLSWQHCGDVVLTGDSRVYRGVDPEAVAAQLGPVRALNYGFDGNGYTPEYLQAVEGLLAPGGRRTVVLGITPNSLTPKACRSNGFFRARRTYSGGALGPWEIMQARLETRLESTRFKETVKAFSPGYVGKSYHHELLASGWVASTKQPEDDSEAIGAYQTNFTDNQVDPAVVARLLAWVGDRTRAGVHVYAFRPPTTRGMVALENARSGFVEGEFVRRFQQAGGTWLDVPQSQYRTYDGSHLRRDEAQRFSRDLGERIRQCELDRKDTRP